MRQERPPVLTLPPVDADALLGALRHHTGCHDLAFEVAPQHLDSGGEAVVDSFSLASAPPTALAPTYSAFVAGAQGMPGLKSASAHTAFVPSTAAVTMPAFSTPAFSTPAFSAPAFSLTPGLGLGFGLGFGFGAFSTGAPTAAFSAAATASFGAIASSSTRFWPPMRCRPSGLASHSSTP